MPTNVVMPQLGESVVEGTVGKWLKQVGDTVQQYEPILEVNTDKVNTEIPSPAAGTLLQILVPEGATVKAGTVIALIGQKGQVPEAAPATQPASPAPSPAPTPPPAPIPAAQTAEAKPNGSARNRFTPVVARMISEFNISDAELKTIQGTGENGRISKKDIENFLKTRETVRAAPSAETLPAWEQPGTGELFRPTEEFFGKQAQAPAPVQVPPPPTPTTPPAPAKSGVTESGQEIIPHTPMRRAIAEHMVRSKRTAPHVTTVHEADMSRVLAHFNKHQDEFTRQGVKLTYTPYFVQAAVYGLQQVPIVNAQFQEQGVLMKRELNIGIAV